jgi:hypothetical protein
MLKRAALWIGAVVLSLLGLVLALRLYGLRIDWRATCLARRFRTAPEMTLGSSKAARRSGPSLLLPSCLWRNRWKRLHR